MEFFAHPWSMAFGGVLISAPIIIHLINRMRFKRIRWAAMEFLLKSQKRNRRRMIIEQLILLLLRILLVLLAAFLVARYLYGGAGPKGASHLVLVDDSLSMNDRQDEGGNATTAFDQARARTAELARVASKASAAQTMKVFVTSDFDTPIADGRVSSSFDNDIGSGFALRNNKPTLMASSALTALRKARALMDEQKGDQVQKVLHFVSDFRDRDWTTGPGAEDLIEEVKNTLESGIHLSFIDVAGPTRSKNVKVTLCHDNLAIVDFKADARVAIEDAEVEFTITVVNYGSAASQGKQLKVHINGDEALGADQVIDPIPAGERRELKFPLKFKGKPVAEITPKDDPATREQKRRAERMYYHVRVSLGREDNGLNPDNVRDLVLEVRKRVPALVVDGNKPASATVDGADLTHLRAFVDASGNYDLEERKLAELDKADLDLYPSIFLINVPEIPESTVKRLKNYVENGGSLCYFLGEEVKSDHYNSTLFKEGLFPLLLVDRPFDPLYAQGGDMTNVEARAKERTRLRQTDPKPKILFPAKDHPVVHSIAPVARIFRFLSVNVYWKAQPASTWDPDGKQTERLIALPNTAGIETYRARAIGLMDQARTAVNRLAVENPSYAPYTALMESFAREVRNKLAAGDLYFVAETLEDLLTNQGVKDDKSKPSMADLWKANEMKALGEDIKSFREQILFGDPLLVSRRQGKGRVVAFLSTAGTCLRRGVGGEEQVQWNDWGVEPLCATWYVLFLKDLHRYLISEGQAPNRVVGEGVDIAVDAKRYDKKLKWTFEAQPDLSVAGARDKPEVEKESADMVKKGDQWVFSLPPSARTRPGVIRFGLRPIDSTEDDNHPTDFLNGRDQVAYAYNVDALAEGDLKRAATDRLELTDNKPTGAKAGKLMLVMPGDQPPSFQEKVPDASESPWLYLFFILILVVEQAMAVHLSYHLKASEAQQTATPAPAAAAA
jgi:hypothetical protein